MSLLDIAERYDQPLEAGCRMGVCGADPVAVLDGMSCLSPPERDELNTLRRLGLGTSTRMACCARIGPGHGHRVAHTRTGTPDGATRTALRPVHRQRGGDRQRHRRSHRRRFRPARTSRLRNPPRRAEPHALYNRMGISRLVYGRSAMQGLYLLPDQWYAEHGVTAWLNTVATRIDVRSPARPARHRRSAPVRPADSRDGRERGDTQHRRAGPPRELRAARSRRCHADPRVRAAAWLPTRGGGGRRPARSGGRLLAALARACG